MAEVKVAAGSGAAAMASGEGGMPAADILAGGVVDSVNEAVVLDVERW